MDNKASIINEPLGNIIIINILALIVPRVFRLLAELDKGGSGLITYGLEKRKISNKFPDKYLDL
jgi:hypothetical protein